MHPGLKPLVSLCPASVRQALKRWYYPRLFRRFDPSRWTGSEFVSKLVGPGDVVVDAGANIGYVSMLLAHWVGAGGRVHSFEPVDETCAILRSNMAALGLTQVVAHEAALSDESGTGAMVVPSDSSGFPNFYEAHLGAAAGGVPGIRVLRLDEALAGETTAIRFIKIDVEGHEGRTVRGALERLRRDRPALYIEMSSMPDEPGAGLDVHQALLPLGYAAYLPTEGGLRAWKSGERAPDLFYLTPADFARTGARPI